MKTQLGFALALCSAVTAHAETQTFLAYDFKFENGSVLPELRVAYETQRQSQSRSRQRNSAGPRDKRQPTRFRPGDWAR